ncbi:MAG: glycosyltransferase family 4 protein [Luteolibacter sp.]
MESNKEKPLRVLYTFAHKIGAGGVCYAAWEHVKNLSDAGAEVTVFPGVLHRSFPEDIRVHPTLSRGRFRIPYKLMGRLGSCKLHDLIVARRLRKMAGEIDLVHGFAMGSLETFRVAKELGIPTVLERCNAHTRYAYEVVEKECKKLGLEMPAGHAHAFNAVYLRREEQEYEETDYIFCPSDFVARTFQDQGFPTEKLERFRYGYDATACYPSAESPAKKGGLTVLFAAGCAPRKGLHYALDAWLKSSACQEGKFLIVGDFIPGYAEKLSEYISHPSVSLLGYRKDLPDVMRASDVMVLPSIEEGSALVTYDARGAGCVLLVSDSTGAVCEHGKNALVHQTGDVEMLAGHFSRVHEDRVFLARLRAASLETAVELTWSAAGHNMLKAYRRIVSRYRSAAGSVKKNSLEPATH